MSVKKIHDSLFVAYLKYQGLTKSSKMSLMIFFFQAILMTRSRDIPANIPCVFHVEVVCRH